MFEGLPNIDARGGGGGGGGGLAETLCVPICVKVSKPCFCIS